MTASVTVAILHPEPIRSDGPLTRAVATARLTQAERHRAGFLAAGATDVRLITGRSDDGTPFGERLAGIVRTLDDGGLIVLGSGAVPLASDGDLRAFIVAASADEPRALTNNRYSGDIVAMSRAREVVPEVPVLRSDNGLPRWLADRAVPVADCRASWRLGVDIDGPLDLVLLGDPWVRHLPSEATARVRDRITRLRTVVNDPHAEVLVAGRTSPSALRWLERAGAARTRAFIEERGMRTAPAGQRAPHSVLGALLEMAGPIGLTEELERLGDAVLLDTRVLLAHRHLGHDGWPPAEERYASDLLLPEDIRDPWLRDLTGSAVDAGTPILFGGHTLVGPGLRLAVCGLDQAS